MTQILQTKKLRPSGSRVGLKVTHQLGVERGGESRSTNVLETILAKGFLPEEGCSVCVSESLVRFGGGP